MTIQVIQFFDNFQLSLWQKEQALQGDTIVMLLLTSSFVPNQATQVDLVDIVANEISGNGYARQTFASVTLALDSAVPKWDSADIVFGPASGGDIVARYYAIFNDTDAGDVLIGYGLLDDTPADVTVPNGTSMTIAANVLGWFRGNS